MHRASREVREHSQSVLFALPSFYMMSPTLSAMTLAIFKCMI